MTTMDEDQLQDIDTMKNPATWAYNVLPLKRVGSEMVGFLVRNNKPRVYFGNVWDPKFQVIPLSDVPFKDHGDFGSIVRDGWRVDD